jgi:PTS system nitrogen regulatory IIA component
LAAGSGNRIEILPPPRPNEYGNDMKLSTIIQPQHTFIGVSAPTKWRALQTIALMAGKAFGIDSQAVLKALESRENLGSTGIGSGIAVPHAVIDGMTSPRGLLIRFAHPLDFEAIDDIPTDIAFVLLFGENNRSEYLNVLATIARKLQSDGVLPAMRKAKTVDEFYSDFIADSRV